MKLKHIISTTILSCAMAFGVGLGLANHQGQVQEAKAASAGDTLTFYVDASSASWWSGDSAVMKLQTWTGTENLRYDGTWISSTIFKVENVDTTGWLGFEFVRKVGENYYGFSSWCEDFNTRFFTHAGSDKNGTWSNSVPSLYDVTLEVTFASAVPDYVDIYIPGGFNSWAENDSSKMTPNVARTTFTFATTVLADTFKYKLVACYASKGFEWTHAIDADDQPTTISSSDHNTTKRIRTNVSYDFATNLPQKYAVENATITLTMSSRLDASITVYLSSDLTGWANTPARLASAVMTPNAGRTVFTWTIPNETPIGSYGYKIVAMYTNGGQTAVGYDYVLKDNGSGSNATITLNDEDGNYPLSSTVTLPALGAIAFSRDFNTAMATPCADENGDNKSAVSAIWSTWKSAFEALTDGAQSQFASSEDTNVVQARKTYLHVVYVRNYDLAEWTGAPKSARALLSPTVVNETNVEIVIVIAASVCALALGGYFFFRKRKEDR